MSYCNTHGQYSGDGCPDCRDVESELIEHLARQREDLAAAAAHIADAQNNPGDYDCPHCKFRTLKRDSSRCPKCHADPGSRYWDDVAKSEAAAAKAAAEAWERGRPAREAAEARRQNEARKEQLRRKVNGVIIALGVTYWLYALGEFLWSRLVIRHDIIDAILGGVIGGAIMAVVVFFVTGGLVALSNFVFDLL